MQPLPEDSDSLTWQDLIKHTAVLVAILSSFFNFFRQVLIQRSRITLPLIFLFSLLSLFVLYNRSTSYEGTTTFVYKELHPKIFGDMVQRLNELFYFDQVNKAAALLNLKPNQAKLISNIKATDTQGRAFTKNYAFRQEPMVVTISLSGIIDEDSLRQSITNYLNGNPFTRDQLELKKQLLRDEEQFIDEKIQTIDSLLVNLSPKNTDSRKQLTTISIEGTEGKEIYELLNFSKELMKRKAEIQNHLARPENVVAIDNLIVLPKAKITTSALIKYMFIGSVIGFLLSSLLILLLLITTTLKNNAFPFENS